MASRSLDKRGIPAGLVEYLDRADLLELADRVASSYSVPRDVLLIMRRYQPDASARQAYWYELHTACAYPLQKIARLWACDWTTVRHGVQAHARRAVLSAPMRRALISEGVIDLSDRGVRA